MKLSTLQTLILDAQNDKTTEIKANISEISAKKLSRVCAALNYHDVHAVATALLETTIAEICEEVGA